MNPRKVVPDGENDAGENNEEDLEADEATKATLLETRIRKNEEECRQKFAQFEKHKAQLVPGFSSSKTIPLDVLTDAVKWSKKTRKWYLIIQLMK